MITPLEEEVISIIKRDNAEKDMGIGTLLAMREYKLQDEVQEYLKKNPDTSFKDLDDFVFSFVPDVEITDDDEEE